MPAVDLITEVLEATEKIDTLNTKQRQVFNKLHSALDSPIIKRRCFYIHGPGGSGKIYNNNNTLI